jgi:hypothetical protein
VPDTRPPAVSRPACRARRATPSRHASGRA